jgi:hypothetical protein
MSFTDITVSQPIKLPPPFRAVLTPGTHRFQGDWRGYFRNTSERRLIEVGLITLDYCENDEPKVSAQTPPAEPVEPQEPNSLLTTEPPTPEPVDPPPQEEAPQETLTDVTEPAAEQTADASDEGDKIEVVDTPLNSDDEPIVIEETSPSLEQALIDNRALVDQSEDSAAIYTQNTLQMEEASVVEGEGPGIEPLADVVRSEEALPEVHEEVQEEPEQKVRRRRRSKAEIEAEGDKS